MRNQGSLAPTLALILLSFLVPSSNAIAQDLKGAVEQLARDLGNSVPEGRLLVVAISDFPDLQGTVSDLGRYVAERLVTRLSARPEKFRVIERRRLDQVLTELRLSLTDLVDPAKAEQLGKMLGAQAIVVGTLSDLGNNVDIDARIIEIGTNSTLPGVSVTLSKEDTVRQLLERGRLIPAFGANRTGGETSSSPSTVSSSGSYESSELKVDIESIQILKTEQVLVTLRCTSRKPLAIALNVGGYVDQYSYYPTYAVDEVGNRYPLERASALSKHPTYMAAGIPITATLTFSYHGFTPGEVLSLATDIDLFDVNERGDVGKRLKTLNIWIRNIKPKK
jgi:TolB-like protein